MEESRSYNRFDGLFDVLVAIGLVSLHDGTETFVQTVVKTNVLELTCPLPPSPYRMSLCLELEY